MEFSSSSSLSKYSVFLSYQGKYSVFLSYQAKDTGYNIVNDLLKDLKTKNIETFVKTYDAMKQSKISIIIFSENYAESSSCLNELVNILECREAQKQIVIPVFYKVQPESVRKQTGKFGRAFKKLLKKGPVIDFLPESDQNIAPISAKEGIWRNALKCAANLSGFHSLKDGSEATLVDNIIADVLKKLVTGSDRILVGINSSVEKIMDLLDIESPEFLMVGIWGMGGIGKTTIAEQVFNKISCTFDGSCFLENVREKAKKEGLVSMRDNLFSKLLKDDKLEIQTPPICDANTKDRVKGTKVFVVLDDVDDLSHLEVLIGERGTNQFGPGSRVIVTTRNKHVLEAHDITCVYNMQMLDDKEALNLFSYYALRQSQPMELYLEISKKIVEYAQGVPLALKVLGSSLHGKNNIRDWEGALKRLNKLQNLKISEVLKLSYDSLTHEEKDIFLDIACLLKGSNIDMVRNVLGASYISLHSGMTVLIEKSLINIISHKRRSIWDMNSNATYDTVEMHDLIQQMGWNIVTEESEEVGSRSRIWRPEDVCDVLTTNTGTEKIRGILLDVRKGNNVKLDLQDKTQVNQIKLDLLNLDREVFANMHNVQFLHVYDSYDFDSKIKFPRGLESLPKELRYLEWDSCPLEYLPPSFNPTNLVELHLSRSLVKRLWTGKQDLPNLKTLYLTGCKKFVEIPDLSLAKNLKELDFSSCSQLDEIPSSIEHLKNLTHLNLNYCTGLREIPSFIQHLKSLTHLNLSYCHGLTEIPDSIQYLTSLEHLNLEQCRNLTEIPSSIENLTNLTHLILSNCDGLKKIPKSIQNLTNLTHLYLRYCGRLKKIASSIQNLTSLQFLFLDGCYGLTKILTSIQKLTNLTHLSMRSCYGLTKISSSIQNLTNLRELDLDRCYGLTKIPSSIQNLTSLTYLNLRYCSGLTEIPASIQHLRSLTCLNLSYCSGLKEIPSSIQHLNSLTHLYMRDCTKITTLPNLPKNVKFLEIDGILFEVYPPSSALLTNLVELQFLTNLVELVLWNCTAYQQSSSLLEQMNHVRLRGCKIIIKENNKKCEETDECGSVSSDSASSDEG